MNKRLYGHLPAKFDPRVILELGTNIAQDTIPLATRFPAAHVYTFEALPALAPGIAAKLKGVKNVTAYNCAVGERDGSTTFKACKGTTYLARGAGSVLPLVSTGGNDQLIQEDITVPMTRLDTWAKTAGVTKVDLILADLQGYEWQALVGMGQLLDTVTVVQCEVEYEPIYVGQKLYPDMCEFMLRRGFTLVGNWPLARHTFGDAQWLRV